jgi:hypothetical protein
MPRGGRLQGGAIDCFAGSQMDRIMSPEPTGTEGHISPRKRQPGLTGTMTNIDTAANARPPTTALSTSRSEPSPSPVMHLEAVISAVTKAVQASFDEARLPGTSADRRLEDRAVAPAQPVAEAAGRRRAPPTDRSPYPYDVSYVARPVLVASDGMHSATESVAALSVNVAGKPMHNRGVTVGMPMHDRGVTVQHTPVEEHISPSAGPNSTQPRADEVPLRHRIEVKTGVSPRKPSAQGSASEQERVRSEGAWMGTGGGGPAAHGEILDQDVRPLRGLTRVPHAPSADAGILDVDGRPLRGLARNNVTPASSEVDVADLLDVNGQPLRVRGRPKAAFAPTPDADLLDIDGRPLRGRARRANNADQSPSNPISGPFSAPNPISGPFGGPSQPHPPEHFSNRRKPIAHAPDTLSIFNDSEVPPQYYASDTVSVGFRGHSYVPMQVRGKVEGSPMQR